METIEIIGFKPSDDSELKIPLFSMSVSAGVPIPVDNDVSTDIDLNEFLVKHPAATFFAKIHGDALEYYGISDADILVVDTAEEPKDGKIIVVSINGEMTIKVYRLIDGEEFMESQKGQFLPLTIGEMKFSVLGTVTSIIHSL